MPLLIDLVTIANALKKKKKKKKKKWFETAHLCFVYVVYIITGNTATIVIYYESYIIITANYMYRHC